MKVTFCVFLFFILLFKHPVDAQMISVNTMFDSDSLEMERSGNEILNEELSEKDSAPASFFSTTILEPLRFTLRQEISYKVKAPGGIKNNRSSFRLEYKKSFLKYFYLQVDSKLNTFWMMDHRAEARNERMSFQNNFIEGFLQFSIKQTSIKAGVQKMIWGESEAGAVTDVISPRDYSELFFISLEESRRGLPMISVDQFTKVGDWTVFFVPIATFNRYPLIGTAYYFDPFYGNARYQFEKADKKNFEYGLKWRKTFGSVDISLAGASLIDNDYAFRADGLNSNGQFLVTRTKQRFDIGGMTLNYTFGDFILKGEGALKLRRPFNNTSFQITKKNAIDAALGLDYMPGGGSLSLSFEAVNNHVIGWDKEILNIPHNLTSLVFTCYKTFLNQNLSFFLMTIYNAPYTSFLHRSTVSYKVNDHVSLFLNGFYPDVREKRNPNWIYRDQKQIDFKVQYQF